MLANVSNCQYSVVRRALRKNGFKLAEDDKENVNSPAYTIAWSDGAVQAARLMGLQPWQRLNHFPSMEHLHRKDGLARTLRRIQLAFPEAYSFFPRTFVLPEDWSELLTLFNEAKTTATGVPLAGASRKAKSTLIVKPAASCQGRGIFLTRNLDDIDRRTASVVQKYLSRPFLLDGRKFDLRIYVLVTSVSPLRIWLADEGLVRLATEAYVAPKDNPSGRGNLFAHLTNYAINKANDKFEQNTGGVGDSGSGCKRSLSWFRSWLDQQGYSSRQIWGRIGDMIVKTIAAAQPVLARTYRAAVGIHRAVAADGSSSLGNGAGAGIDIGMAGYPASFFRGGGAGDGIGSPVAGDGSAAFSGSSTAGATASSSSSSSSASVGAGGPGDSMRVFELLGFDVILDQHLNPYVLEVNHSPSLTCDSPLDKEVKFAVLDEAIQLLRLKPGDRTRAKERDMAAARQRLYSNASGSGVAGGTPVGSPLARAVSSSKAADAALAAMFNSASSSSSSSSSASGNARSHGRWEASQDDAAGGGSANGPPKRAPAGSIYIPIPSDCPFSKAHLRHEIKVSDGFKLIYPLPDPKHVADAAFAQNARENAGLQMRLEQLRAKNNNTTSKPEAGGHGHGEDGGVDGWGDADVDSPVPATAASGGKLQPSSSVTSSGAVPLKEVDEVDVRGRAARLEAQFRGADESRLAAMVGGGNGNGTANGSPGLNKGSPSTSAPSSPAGKAAFHGLAYPSPSQSPLSFLPGGGSDNSNSSSRAGSPAKQVSRLSFTGKSFPLPRSSLGAHSNSSSGFPSSSPSLLMMAADVDDDDNNHNHRDDGDAGREPLDDDGDEDDGDGAFARGGNNHDSSSDDDDGDDEDADDGGDGDGAAAVRVVRRAAAGTGSPSNSGLSVSVSPRQLHKRPSNGSGGNGPSSLSAMSTGGKPRQWLLCPLRDGVCPAPFAVPFDTSREALKRRAELYASVMKRAAELLDAEERGTLRPGAASTAAAAAATSSSSSSAAATPLASPPSSPRSASNRGLMVGNSSGFGGVPKRPSTAGTITASSGTGNIGPRLPRPASFVSASSPVATGTPTAMGMGASASARAGSAAGSSSVPRLAAPGVGSLGAALPSALIVAHTSSAASLGSAQQPPLSPLVLSSGRSAMSAATASNTSAGSEGFLSAAKRTGRKEGPALPPPGGVSTDVPSLSLSLAQLAASTMNLRRGISASSASSSSSTASSSNLSQGHHSVNSGSGSGSGSASSRARPLLATRGELPNGEDERLIQQRQQLRQLQREREKDGGHVATSSPKKQKGPAQPPQAGQPQPQVGAALGLGASGSIGIGMGLPQRFPSSSSLSRAAFDSSPAPPPSLVGNSGGSGNPGGTGAGFAGSATSTAVTRRLRPASALPLAGSGQASSASSFANPPSYYNPTAAASATGSVASVGAGPSSVFPSGSAASSSSSASGSMSNGYGYSYSDYVSYQARAGAAAPGLQHSSHQLPPRSGTANASASTLGGSRPTLPRAGSGGSMLEASSTGSSSGGSGGPGISMRAARGGAGGVVLFQQPQSQQHGYGYGGSSTGFFNSEEFAQDSTDGLNGSDGPAPPPLLHRPTSAAYPLAAAAPTGGFGMGMGLPQQLHRTHSSSSSSSLPHSLSRSASPLVVAGPVTTPGSGSMPTPHTSHGYSHSYGARSASDSGAPPLPMLGGASASSSTSQRKGPAALPVAPFPHEYSQSGPPALGSSVGRGGPGFAQAAAPPMSKQAAPVPSSSGPSLPLPGLGSSAGGGMGMRPRSAMVKGGF